MQMREREMEAKNLELEAQLAGKHIRPHIARCQACLARGRVRACGRACGRACTTWACTPARSCAAVGDDDIAQIVEIALYRRRGRKVTRQSLMKRILPGPLSDPTQPLHTRARPRGHTGTHGRVAARMRIHTRALSSLPLTDPRLTTRHARARACVRLWRQVELRSCAGRSRPTRCSTSRSSHAMRSSPERAPSTTPTQRHIQWSTLSCARAWRQSAPPSPSRCDLPPLRP